VSNDDEKRFRVLAKMSLFVVRNLQKTPLFQLPTKFLAHKPHGLLWPGKSSDVLLGRSTYKF